MRLNGVFTAPSAALVLIVFSGGSARAADGSLTGRWVHQQEDLLSKRIEAALVSIRPAQPDAVGGHSRPLADDKDDKKDEKPDEVKLPGGGTCDTTALESRFKVLKVRPDAAHGKVVWIMEAKEDITSIVAEGTLYDEDEVRIGSASILVEPNSYIKKGDHVRFTLVLPADTVMQKVKKISIK